jgi:osmotically inducible lipoprotein OsmB
VGAVTGIGILPGALVGGAVGAGVGAATTPEH